MVRKIPDADYTKIRVFVEKTRVNPFVLNAKQKQYSINDFIKAAIREKLDREQI